MSWITNMIGCSGSNMDMVAPLPRELHVAREPISVFLAGSCNPTTWRKDIAIPFFEKHGIAYYNPQVDNWDTSLIEKEAKAKDRATTILFVIDEGTRAIASMIEAAYYAGLGRDMDIVVMNYTSHLPSGEVSKEVALTLLEESNDNNRGRAYLLDMIKRSPNVRLHTTIEDACSSFNKRAQNQSESYK